MLKTLSIALLATGAASLLRLGVGEAGAFGAVPSAARRPYARVVSAGLSTDEIALALLEPRESTEPPRLIAVSMFADDEGVSNVTSEARGVPARVTASTEALVALRPDVVLADPFTQLSTDRLTAPLGIPVVRTKYPARLTDIAENILYVGEVLGADDRAQKVAAQFVARTEAVRSRVHGLPTPRVLYYSRGFTSGSGTLATDILACAGARNAAAEAGIIGLRAISVEEVLAMDPDVLVLGDYRADGGRRDISAKPESVHHPVWRSLRAVRGGHVIELPPRMLLSTSQHLASGVEALAEALHPEIAHMKAAGP